VQNVLASGRVRFVVPDTLKLQVLKSLVLAPFQGVTLQSASILVVNLLSCGLFYECIVTLTVAAWTEGPAAAYLHVLQVRIPSGRLDVSFF